ncbi:hypothetical protein [Cytobacillus stercorigallinarum]|uniref:hypothetical protein n=1 Tax=Cytobacillus stercorigallinarum TaxID=2762240 RepID=UPI001CD8873A|nr:hypothetical protein [Cytobacillus stercorigallinarum]
MKILNIGGSPLELIASLTYIKVVRKIDWNVQKYEEIESEIKLFDKKIKWSEDEIDIHAVFDISFRESKKKLGTLYLHTNRGVYPFYMRDVPKHFIEQYRNLIKK